MVAGKQVVMFFMFVLSCEQEIHKNTNVIKICPSFLTNAAELHQPHQCSSAGQRCSTGRGQSHIKNTRNKPLHLLHGLLDKTWFIPFSWKQPLRHEAVRVFVRQEEGWPTWGAGRELLLTPTACRSGGTDKNSVLTGQRQWTPLLSLQGAFPSLSVAQCWANLILKKDLYFRKG